MRIEVEVKTVSFLCLESAAAAAAALEMSLNIALLTHSLVLVSAPATVMASVWGLAKAPGGFIGVRCNFNYNLRVLL